MPLVSSEMNRFFDAKGTDMLLSLLYHVLSFFGLNIVKRHDQTGD